ncbi:MAG: Gfo/Idh/MocA family oxidoreductase [Reichenbachiella sp.]
MKEPQNRRSFIKKTALGLGALTSGVSLVKGNDLTSVKQLDRKMGVALVGLGYYASKELGPALLETKNCYLAGIVTGTKEKEQEWSEKYDIPQKNIYNYDNFDEIAKNKDIDIVYIVLPNSMHAEFTIRAAKAKKHVICEKPMAISVDECQRMIDACSANKVYLSIGYRLHFDPFHQRIMEFVKDKKFGQTKFVAGNFGFKIGDPTQWRLKKALAGGGSLMDVGIYSIQACRYSVGEEPVSVSAQAFKSDAVKFKDVDDTVTWQLNFPSGAVASCSSSYSFNVNKLAVSFEEGIVDIPSAYGYRGIRGTIETRKEGSMNLRPENPKTNQQAMQIDDFAWGVANKKQIKITGEEGLKDLKIIEAIYKSIEKGGQTINI